MESMEKPMRLLPAKTGRGEGGWLPLWMHARDTAEMMGFLWDSWLSPAARRCFTECAGRGESEAELRELCWLLGYLHDLGKASRSFVYRILPALDRECRRRLEEAGLQLPKSVGTLSHARAGERILCYKGCPESVAAVVGAHHGVPQSFAALTPEEEIEDFSYDLYTGEQTELWQEVWDELIAEGLSHGNWSSLSELPQLRMKQQMLLSGMLIMADWIASNPHYFPLLPAEMLGTASCYPERAKCGWDRLQPPAGWVSSGFSLEEESFRQRFEFSPNAVQQMMMDAAAGAVQPGVYILEAQMGVGKTEAALAAAETFARKWGCGGLFFGLPTQATANGIFPRLMRWAGQFAEEARLSVRLAHGAAELNEDYRALFQGEAELETAEEERDGQSGDGGLLVHNWFRGRKQALLSDFVIGTVDQLLMAALQQRHVMLRHFGIVGKVVIIDECHAYDAFMLEHLRLVLTWLGAYAVPVVLLSATLPRSRRAELIDAYLGNAGRRDTGREEWREARQYPLLTWTDGKEVQQRTTESENAERLISISRCGMKEIFPRLRVGLRDGGCAAVIVNTVRRAQELARQALKELPGIRIHLLHSRFLGPDRAEKEAELLRLVGKKSTAETRDRLLVIGTQVVEQSLDLDFDFMLTELCPMDLLIQRIGRLHRHKEHDACRPERLRDPSCIVVLLEEGELRRSVYDGWIQHRTKELLPRVLRLPSDIPTLINAVYEEGQEGREAERYYGKQRQLRRKASAFQIEYPPSEEEVCFDTIHSLLDRSCCLTEEGAKASVRDGEDSLEVLLLRRVGDTVGYLPWQFAGQRLDPTAVPDAEECRRLLSQRIRLPNGLMKACGSAAGDGSHIDRLPDELHRLRRRQFPEWEYASPLSGELILLLEEDLTLHFMGYILRYSREYGLEYRKETENEGGV